MSILKKLLISFSIIGLMFVNSVDNSNAVTIISNPSSISFYIPLKSSTSGTYSDGFGQSSDSVWLEPSGTIGDTSDGWLDIRFEFSPIPAVPANTPTELHMVFQDLDLLPYNISSVIFFETAYLTIGLTEIVLLNEIYAINDPTITETNNVQLDMWLDLVPDLFSGLPETTYLDIRLSANLKNEEDRGVWLRNTRESILGAEIVINSVPEPSTLLLLGSGLVALGFLGRKKKRIKG